MVLDHLHGELRITFRVVVEHPVFVDVAVLVLTSEGIPVLTVSLLDGLGCLPTYMLGTSMLIVFMSPLFLASGLHRLQMLS